LDGHADCRELFEMLSSYLEGELPSGSCEELAKHLCACEPCRRYLESLKSTRDALQASGRAEPMAPGDVSRSLEACLKAFRDKCPG